MPPENARAYVYFIMPIGADALFHQKRQILESYAKRTGIAIHFPMDRIQRYPMESRPVSDQLAELSAALMVVADLTYERPSCYYELGLADSVRADVRLIAMYGTDIHQSSNRHQTKFYSDLPSYEKCVEDVLSEGAR